MIRFALNNIRSAWNTGSIMRTCDALGFGLIFVGYTPKPIGASLPMVKKTAIGAENTVPWVAYEHFQNVLKEWEKAIHIGIEIDDKSQDIFTYLRSSSLSPDKDYILWLGNEISGLDQDLMQHLHYNLHLPMFGLKESLNVANTATAVGYLFLEHLYSDVSRVQKQ